jgi:hypothetical protein
MAADTAFSSPVTLAKYVHTVLGTHDNARVPDVTAYIDSRPVPLERKPLIGEASYISITFGCLVFTIIGFYIGQISKLKVGSIELEKDVIDQINTNLQSLGITAATT